VSTFVDTDLRLALQNMRDPRHDAVFTSDHAFDSGLATSVRRIG
jgi:hypothetical protein